MTVKNFIENLLIHMHWADAQIWKTVLAIPQAKDYEKLKEILHHYHVTKYAFYDIWIDRSFDFSKIKKVESLQDMADRAAKYPETVQLFLSNLNEEDLNRVIHIPWAGHMEKALGKKVDDVTLAGTMIQVAAHSSHHRGQVSSIIRGLNAEPPMVDYIAWVWLGKPAVE